MEISILDHFEHFSSKNYKGHFFKFFCQNSKLPSFNRPPFPRKWTQRATRPHFQHQKGLNFQIILSFLSFFEYFYFSKSILSKKRFHQKFFLDLKKKKKMERQKSILLTGICKQLIIGQVVAKPGSSEIRQQRNLVVAKINVGSIAV